MITFPYESIKIDKRSAHPIHTQLAQSIKLLVYNNQLAYKSILPSIFDVSAELKIRKSDVEKAYQMLQDEKYVTFKNQEYIINYFHFSANFFLDVVPLFEAIRNMGMTPSVKTLSKKLQKFPKDLTISANLNPQEKYYVYKRLYLGNDIPLIILESFIPQQKFPNLDHTMKDDEPLYEAFYKYYQIRIASSDRLFKVVTLDKENASLLKTIPGTASYQGISVGYDSTKTIIDITRSWSIINYFFEIEYDRDEIEKIIHNHLFFI
jgi:GntR family transcriptional regulator